MSDSVILSLFHLVKINLTLYDTFSLTVYDSDYTALALVYDDVVRLLLPRKGGVLRRLDLLGWTQQEISDQLQGLWPDATGISKNRVAEACPENGNDHFRDNIIASLSAGTPLPTVARWEETGFVTSGNSAVCPRGLVRLVLKNFLKENHHLRGQHPRSPWYT